MTTNTISAIDTHLDRLESESIHVLREVAAEYERPALLYSIGKDSSVILHLARKAFYPGESAVQTGTHRLNMGIP